MRPLRSLLFIPGNREKWVETAHTHGADAVVLDLEDSVPPAEKEDARQLIRQYLPSLQEHDQEVWVRVNGHPNDNNGFLEQDLEAVVHPELEGIYMSKARVGDDVQRLDTVLTHIERRDGLEPGHTELIVAIETAAGMRNVYELCDAADRVASISNGAVKGADTNHALKFNWSGPGREGLETVHMREKALLDARAAGVQYPLAGTYVDVGDIDGLREDMQFSLDMGFMGYVVIHPSHVEHANEIFLPDPEEIEYWMGVRDALAEAEEEGSSAVRYEGEMIDAAHLATAEEFLRRARAFEEDLEMDVEIK